MIDIQHYWLYIDVDIAVWNVYYLFIDFDLKNQ